MRTIEAQAASLGPSAPEDAPPPAAAAPAEEYAKRQAPLAAHAAKSAKNRAENGDLEDALQPVQQNAMRGMPAPKPAAQTLDNAPAENVPPQTVDADSNAAAPAAAQNAQAESQERAGMRNQVAEKAGADAVARSRQLVADAQTPEERVAALKQLIAAAQAAGDQKTAKAAQGSLKAMQAQVVARKRAEGLQETPPAQRAKAAPSQGSGELKADKARQ